MPWRPGSLVDLVRHDGAEVAVTDATTAARGVLLDQDLRTRARALVVEFPVGFSRPFTGHYDEAEEIVVLEGAFSLGDWRLSAGDWAWLPAGMIREPLTSEGAVAYAWFAGRPRWARTTAAGSLEPLWQCLESVRERSVLVGPPVSATTRSSVVPAGEVIEGPCHALDLVNWSWRALGTGVASTALAAQHVRVLLVPEASGLTPLG